MMNELAIQILHPYLEKLISDANNHKVTPNLDVIGYTINYRGFPIRLTIGSDGKDSCILRLDLSGFSSDGTVGQLAMGVKMFDLSQLQHATFTDISIMNP